MVETILSSPFFMELILPAVLIFTIVFAILQKSKVFGDGKVQVDAIVALVIALIVVSFGKATGIIVNLMPFLAVSLIVIMVFMILVGSIGVQLGNSVKIAIGVAVAIAVIVAVLLSTGGWDYLLGLFSGGASAAASNVLFIILIAAAVAVVVGFGKGAAGGGK